MRLERVDRILCRLEQKEFGMPFEPNKELRLVSLSDPASFKRRIGRLFPVFSEK